VTDANVVLGYYNPESLAGGTLRIRRDLAEEAVRRHVAGPLGISTIAAAHGIREIAIVNMSRAIRSVTVERGRDPRDMALMAFGGSGPAHAVDVARALGIKRVIVPMLSGVFCSVGMLASDIEHNFVRTVMLPLALATPEAVDGVASELRTEGLETLRQEGYGSEAVELKLAADLRYFGQSSELTVAFPEGAFSEHSRESLYSAFQTAYETTFGYSNDEPLELVNLRLTARGIRPNRLTFGQTMAVARSSGGHAGTREVAFTRDGGLTRTPVEPRAAASEKPRRGPVIFEAYDTTIVVPPDATARTDSCGSIVIDLD
jgi:N-methylhydantoinase A